MLWLQRLSGSHRLYSLIVEIFMFALPLHVAHAQEDVKQKISLVHQAPTTSALPPVGGLLRIQVELRNTVDITAKIRLVGSKDGRFIDIAFPKGALNAADHPTFSVEIPSPVAAMTYQFVLRQPDGSATTTNRYVIKRKCIQNYAVDVPDTSASAAYSREVAKLVGRAKELERDTASLEASLKLLEEMKASISR
jgi:hypothetical protein